MIFFDDIVSIHKEVVVIATRALIPWNIIIFIDKLLSEYFHHHVYGLEIYNNVLIIFQFYSRAEW